MERLQNIENIESSDIIERMPNIKSLGIIIAKMDQRETIQAMENTALSEVFGTTESSSKSGKYLSATMCNDETISELEHLCINDVGNSVEGNTYPLCEGGGNDLIKTKDVHLLSIDEASPVMNRRMEGYGDITEYLNEREVVCETPFSNSMEVCAICHSKIKLEETAQIKGCEHSYCVICILRWASCKVEPWCPQCRFPFSFLYVYRALDGTLSDYMFEESVCLLLRASWFKPLILQAPEEQDDYGEDDDIYEEPYHNSSIRLGNRRWGDSGYVRAGRREAKPVTVKKVIEPGCSASSSRESKGKEKAKEALGRRARRAQKREQLEGK